ncbi:hypothetical protein [Actinoplanes regularis]|uniref:hypothetical protein n=1 Tax=Actinoplanes regularis TaxID=52697 RepID=UPI0024A39D98|nr:hypothetical protein [Actinoplanes regularis]GLW31809.1 hypothetical protein Areg01_47480 [Actinoplanes regularis]
MAEENTELKRRLRQLTDENRILQRKLQAARSNNRLADLEAELIDERLNPISPRLSTMMIRKSPVRASLRCPAPACRYRWAASPGAAGVARW